MMRSVCPLHDHLIGRLLATLRLGERSAPGKGRHSVVFAVSVVSVECVVSVVV